MTKYNTGDYCQCGKRACYQVATGPMSSSLIVCGQITRKVTRNFIYNVCDLCRDKEAVIQGKKEWTDVID